MSLRHRKALRVRLSQCFEVQDILDSMKTEDANDIVGTLRQFGLELFVSEESPQAQDRIPLDNFVRLWATTLKEQAVAQVNPRLRGILSEITERLVAEAEYTSCSTCAGLVNQICRGNDDDDAIVERSGQCIREIREMFRYSADLARDTYTRAFATWRLAHPSRWPEFRLSTQHVTEISRNFVHPAKISAGMTPLPLNDARPSDVVLVMVADRFDRDSLSLLPYAFLHEIFAHGYQRLSANPRMTNEHDSFAEGWMDSVARRVLEQAADANALTVGGLPLRRCVAAATDFAMSRAKTDKDARDGEEAATRLEKYIGRITTYGRPKDVLIDLSCALNAADVNIGDRRILVQGSIDTFADLFTRSGVPRGSSLNRSVALSKALTERSVENFVRVFQAEERV